MANAITQMSRRTLLAGACSTAAAVAARTTVGGDVAGIDAGRPIRVAVIGLGLRGRQHAAALLRTAGAGLVALCDADDRRLAFAELPAGSAARVYTDYRRLLDECPLDAVTVATDEASHAAIAVAALAAGKHVYVEKPCAVRLAEGRMLAEAARRHGRLCRHGTQGRWSPALAEAMERVAAGSIGSLCEARVYCSPPSRRREGRLGGGQWESQLVHLVDTACWGLESGLGRPVGLPVAVVPAGGGQPARFDFAVGAPLLVEVRTDGRLSPPGVEIAGDRGRIVIEGYGYKLFDPAGTVAARGEQAPDEFAEFVRAVGGHRPVDPAAEMAAARRTAAICRLGAVATRLGRRLHLDPATETVRGDRQAAALV